jgi:hypothetical protein
MEEVWTSRLKHRTRKSWERKRSQCISYLHTLLYTARDPSKNKEKKHYFLRLHYTVHIFFRSSLAYSFTIHFLCLSYCLPVHN